MSIDFAKEYSERTDGELLHLASARHSLIPEAAAALEVELHRRHLAESDRVEHQRFVKRQGHRETRKPRRWKILAVFKEHLSWLDWLWILATYILISLTYLALPSRYRLKPDWLDAAACVMIASVVLVFAASISWRNITFGISLGISSAIHLLLAHALLQRVPNPVRTQTKGIAFLGFFLFLAVYWLIRLLRRLFYREKSLTMPGDTRSVLE